MDDSLLVSRLGKQLLIARRQQRSCSTRRKVRGPMATALPKFPDCCSWCAACSSEVPFTGSIGTASLRGCAAVFGRFCTGARFSPDRSECIVATYDALRGRGGLSSSGGRWRRRWCWLLFRDGFSEFCVDLGRLSRANAVVIGVRFGEFALALEQCIEPFSPA